MKDKSTALLKNLPQEPGCYLFKNSSGNIIYIGKAKNIKKRVSSYFQKTHEYEFTNKLVREIDTMGWILTTNEVEALLLEAKLIKAHQPAYNIRLKDDKSYPYIKITREKFPRLITARAADIKPNDILFGPFVSGEARREIMRLANSLLKLRVCKTLPKRACLLFHIGLCSAPCIGKISEAEYLQNIEKAKMLLRGKNNELISILEKEMKQFSEEQNYEQAKLRRDQLRALERMKEKEVVHLRKPYNQDVINYILDMPNIYIQLFNIHKGVVSGRRDYTIDASAHAEPKEAFSEFVRQYYFSHDIPKEVILPHTFFGMELLSKYLSRLAGFHVRVTVPRAGEKKKLLVLLKKNIIASHTVGLEELVRLKAALRLPKYPNIIECFDISNLGGKYLVGSMVQFHEGKPRKSEYRRFRIKTVHGQSDFDSMKEVVFRRYQRLLSEKKPFPDLVALDGGKPQLTAGISALQEAGAQIPVIALAKQQEEIYTTDSMAPIKLSKKDPALKILQRIRDEAHRFANAYRKILQKKDMLGKLKKA